MSTIVATHEVDDVDRWRASPRREELFGPLGITHRTFVAPDSKQVVVVLDVPNMADFEMAMQSDAAAAAMKDDGVHPETLHLYIEG